MVYGWGEANMGWKTKYRKRGREKGEGKERMSKEKGKKPTGEGARVRTLPFCISCRFCNRNRI